MPCASVDLPLRFPGADKGFTRESREDHQRLKQPKQVEFGTVTPRMTPSPILGEGWGEGALKICLQTCYIVEHADHFASFWHYPELRTGLCRPRRALSAIGTTTRVFALLAQCFEPVAIGCRPRGADTIGCGLGVANTDLPQRESGDHH